MSGRWSGEGWVGVRWSNLGESARMKRGCVGLQSKMEWDGTTQKGCEVREGSARMEGRCEFEGGSVAEGKRLCETRKKVCWERENIVETKERE